MPDGIRPSRLPNLLKKVRNLLDLSWPQDLHQQKDEVKPCLIEPVIIKTSFILKGLMHVFSCPYYWISCTCNWKTHLSSFLLMLIWFKDTSYRWGQKTAKINFWTFWSIIQVIDVNLLKTWQQHFWPTVHSCKKCCDITVWLLVAELCHQRSL